MKKYTISETVKSLHNERLNDYLSDYHSIAIYFLESGKGPKCRDRNGRWIQLTKARFTGDDIARRGYRMEYAGGTEGNKFLHLFFPV
jgi:hypothetical protein